MNDRMKLDEAQLEKVSGGAGKQKKYVSSFFCEKCGKTIRLNGVYTLENAVRMHEEKEHRAPQGKRQR